MRHRTRISEEPEREAPSSKNAPWKRILSLHNWVVASVFVALGAVGHHLYTSSEPIPVTKKDPTVRNIPEVKKFDPVQNEKHVIAFLSTLNAELLAMEVTAQNSDNIEELKKHHYQATGYAFALTGLHLLPKSLEAPVLELTRSVEQYRSEMAARMAGIAFGPDAFAKRVELARKAAVLAKTITGKLRGKGVQIPLMNLDISRPEFK